MRAIVYHGPGDLRLEDRPEPRRTDNNLVAAVRGCALCGTDLKLATVGNPRCHPPRIVGHEMVGTVIHVGSAVAGFAVGDRITLATTVACGTCAECAAGLGNLCGRSEPISYDHDGALAEFIAIPPGALRGGNVIKVPPGLSDDAACLSEPLSCAINAQRLAGVRPGDAVVIVGGGALGALHAVLALATGAAKALVVQRSEPRVSMLRRLPGVQVTSAGGGELLDYVRRETAGRGADVVVVCAPSREAQEEALALARKGGAISLFASLPKGDSAITLDSRLIHYSELRVVGASDSRPEHVRAAVDLLAAHQQECTRVITHRLPLEEFASALDLMKRKQALKIVLGMEARA
ncbi:MAG: alcohol dehydrogenase catalytic domain-containing protein [Kiritimatiellae bacterium]|nr:alcohol dehydrogenase catalytic domain-containing protein [Kiritimatiellia bacterium]